MRRLLIGLGICLALVSPAWAQTAGPVAVKAVDTSTGALTDVGDNTNHAIRVNIIAGAGSGGTAAADNAAFTQGTTSETPMGCLYNTSYANATTGHNTIPRCTITGDLYTNLDAIAGNAVSTAASGVQKVGIVGNAGAAFDAAGQNVASPANELLIGGQFNTSPTTITNGNMSPFQLDSAANLLTKINVALPAGTATIGATKFVDACGTSNQDFEAQLTATTLTSITATTTCVDYITVTNIGSAQTTILGQDVSTNCNSGVCSWIPTTALAPNASLTFAMYGLKFQGGIKLQASVANNLQYAIHGRQ